MAIIIIIITITTCYVQNSSFVNKHSTNNPTAFNQILIQETCK
jgi:hypothetical protein